ncbi:unnamed protein product [Coregonus sp. 'balchen']|nr:unnamed protein product [Coregonus sp. 'balchen']
MGDLLLGRDRQLHASSTCGLTGSEVFCTLFGQTKLFWSDSSVLAEFLHIVLSSLQPKGTDWLDTGQGQAGPSLNPLRPGQAEVEVKGSGHKGKINKTYVSLDVSPVTLQLDLQNLFQLDSLVLTFKGPRPSALVVERTLDNGKTWQPALYMASDCSSAFPGIAMTMPRSLDQTYCYTLPPATTNPYQDQIIQFSPLRQFSTISIPNGRKIQEVSGLTGLRVMLTKLGAVPRLPGRAPSLFYALREMRVMGTCLCHGHANRCLPDTNQLPNTQVSAQCECQHNTAGTNCERCADLYNDLPWRPAEEGHTHTCKRCECNNHAQRCRFDPAVYESSGRRSGGVCESCLHHTTGPKCDRCAPGYQPNHRSSMDRPDACIRCHCSAEGVENGDQCDDVTGSCRCKANVDGSRCDRCKMGYYGLTASNPLGCNKCPCSKEGSVSSVCDPVSGQCPCRPHLQGLTCDQCSHGYWNPSSPRGCEPCRCDPTNSHGDTCDQSTACQCAAGGTVPGGCDKRTGACQCQLGVTGARCDACTRGHCDSFPDCEVCPSCFFSLDMNIQNLTLGLERLFSRIPSLPGGSLPTGLGPRIRTLEATLTQIRDSLPMPPPSARQVNDALSQLRRLRDQLDQVDGDLSPQGRAPELGSQLDELQALLDGLGLVYNTKRDALRNSVNPNYAGAFSSIKNAYDESTDSAKNVDASGKTVERSTAVREDALDLQNQVQPANTIDLEKLNQQLNTKPDLTPTAKQVCGSVRFAPCTPAQCDGELCPAEGAPPCGRGERCVGALPLGTRAVSDAEEVKDRLKQLNGKITQAAARIQETQDTANQVRQSTDDLANQMRQARDDLDADLQETRDFVKELKDFLSDPSSDLTLISTVSEWILNAKLPVSLATLKRKLKEIRDLAAGLPDSTAVLDQAGPQLDTARRLLQEAQDARDAALGVKADVDGLLEGFTTVEGSLSGLEDKVQDSLDIVDDISSNLTQTKAQLSPAVKALGEVSALAEGMKPQLEGLWALRSSGRGDGTGRAGERLQKLQEEAGSLAQDTGDMIKALAGKADSLHSLQGEVLLTSQRLNGLETKLLDLLADMRQKVTILSTCQG